MPSSKSIAAKDLLDLAISSAEPGIVNFNVVRKILDILLREANLFEKPIDLADPAALLAKPNPQPSPPLLAPSGLAERISKLENAVQNIVSLPTNQQILEAAEAAAKGQSSIPRHSVAERFNTMLINGKVDTLESTVAKVASLVDDILDKETKMTQTAREMGSHVTDLEYKLKQLGTPDVAEGKLATWEGLYQAVEGAADKALEKMQSKTNIAIVTEDVKKKSQGANTDHSPTLTDAGKKKRKSEAKPGTSEKVPRPTTPEPTPPPSAPLDELRPVRSTVSVTVTRPSDPPSIPASLTEEFSSTPADSEASAVPTAVPTAATALASPATSPVTPPPTPETAAAPPTTSVEPISSPSTPRPSSPAPGPIRSPSAPPSSPIAAQPTPATLTTLASADPAKTPANEHQPKTSSAKPKEKKSEKKAKVKNAPLSVDRARSPGSSESDELRPVDSQLSLTPVLRDMRQGVDRIKDIEKRLKDLEALMDTKADKKDLKDAVGRIDQMSSDLTTFSKRTEELFTELRTLRTDHEALTKAFDDYAASRRHTIRRSTGSSFTGSGIGVAGSRSGGMGSLAGQGGHGGGQGGGQGGGHGGAQGSISSDQNMDSRRSQGCTAFGSAIPGGATRHNHGPTEGCGGNCPVGSPLEPVDHPVDPRLNASSIKLQGSRIDAIHEEMEKYRTNFEDLRAYINEQILILSEKQASLEADIAELIKMFKERRRPTLKVATLDMNVVEKMLDDYEHIIEDMKTYDSFNTQLSQKTDRLFYLCDELKRNKADGRTVRDALELKADTEDLLNKADRMAMEEFTRSNTIQIEQLIRQMQCNESLVRNELGKLLETLSTRASQNSVEELRGQFRDVSQTGKGGSLQQSGGASVKFAAGTSCPLTCLSCGDHAFQEPTHDRFHPAGFPPRDMLAPYTAYGRAREVDATYCTTPRRNSCSPGRPVGGAYTTMIDQHHQAIRKHKGGLGSENQFEPSGATGRFGQTAVMKPPPLDPADVSLSSARSQVDVIASKIAAVSRPTTGRKKTGKSKR